MYEIGSFSSEYLYNLLDYKDKIFELAKDIVSIKEEMVNKLDYYQINYINTFANFIHIRKNHISLEVKEKLESICYYRHNQNHPSVKDYIRFTIGEYDTMMNIINLINNNRIV